MTSSTPTRGPGIAVPHFGNAEQQHPERHRLQRRAAEIELHPGQRRQRQCPQRDDRAQHAQRHVHREQIRPHGATAKDDGGDRRSQRRGDRSDGGIQSDSAAKPAAGIDEADQGAVDAHDPRGAEALQHARDDQRRQRGRQRAGQRGEGEQHQAGLVDAAVAVDFSQ